MNALDVTTVFVTSQSSIRDAVSTIDRTMAGIVLAVDNEQQLIGTITDGDIRRALLAGISLDSPVQILLDAKPAPAPRTPTTAPVGTPDAALLELMNRHDLRHIPLIEADGRVVGLALLRDLVQEYELPLRALVMAGGYGQRLRPLTEDRPKPMLPVGDRPLLEWIVGQLQAAGIRRVNVATHYRADVIERHFGDGRQFGVDINYVNEDQPLGTAGALSLLGESNEPLLVMNGDILTRVNVAAMLEFHRSHDADMTVAVRPYEYQIPFGVLTTDGVTVTSIDEKPLLQHLVSAGIYLLNGTLCRLVPPGRPYDMTDLIARVLDERLRVISFPLREYWLDIGRAEDYVKARADIAGNKT